jgi:AIG2-like family
MIIYFAYGANISMAAMRHRCPDAQAVGPAALEGFRFFVGREGWGSVQPSRGDKVHGVLWRLTLRDLAVLHSYELLHKGLYDIRRLPVLHEGHRVPALSYLLRRRVPGRPRPGYIESIAAAAREWRLPERYIRGVERWSPSGFRGATGIDVGGSAKDSTREFL